MGSRPGRTDVLTPGIPPGYAAGVSPMIFPSWISRTRWAMCETRASCVTTTIVFPNSWLSRRNRSRTSWPVFVSSSPVGSSARRSGGSFARATPMATRCCSPPLSSSGRRLARSGMPTSSLSATCMSRPRSAITSDFPVRYTLIRSFVRMFGRSTTSELEHAGDVHPRDANRDREGRQEHGGGREDKEEERLDWDREEHRHEGLSRCSRARGDEGRRQVRGEDADSRADNQADQHDR